MKFFLNTKTYILFFFLRGEKKCFIADKYSLYPFTDEFKCIKMFTCYPFLTAFCTNSANSIADFFL